MFRLALMILPLVATSFMGIAVLATLVSGHDTLNPILKSAAAGLLISIPVTLLVAHRIIR